MLTEFRTEMPLLLFQLSCESLLQEHRMSVYTWVRRPKFLSSHANVMVVRSALSSGWFV